MTCFHYSLSPMALASVEKNDSLYAIKRYVKIYIILARVLRFTYIEKTLYH